MVLGAGYGRLVSMVIDVSVFGVPCCDALTLLVSRMMDNVVKIIWR